MLAFLQKTSALALTAYVAVLIVAFIGLTIITQGVALFLAFIIAVAATIVATIKAFLAPPRV